MGLHRYGLFFNEQAGTYIATPQLSTMNKAATLTYLAEELDKSKVKVGSVLGSFGKALAAVGVNFGLSASAGKFGSSQIVVTGGFAGHAGPWVFGKNFLQIIFRVSNALKTALSSIIPTPITGDVIPTVKSVYDETRDSYAVVGYGDTVAISGDDLAPDEDKEDEGIFLGVLTDLVHQEYTYYKLTNVLSSELQIVRFVIDNAQIPVGGARICKLVVKTRCGMGADYPLKTIEKSMSYFPREAN